jgi:hypothetical protein
MAKKASTQERVLMAAIEADVNVMLWGEPGIGKSAVIESMLPQWGYAVEPVMVSQRDPSDLNGLPMVNNEGEVVMAPPRWATRANSAEKTVVFFDEYSQATPAVQGATLRSMQERWVGELKLGDHVRFILAANPPECAAGGFDIAAPAANRMMHLNWNGATSDDWALGVTNGWDTITPDYSDAALANVTEDRIISRKALVSAYIMSNPSALHNLPDDPSEAGRAWASRRTWEMLANILPYISDNDYDALLMAASGCVGEGAGTAFAVWIQNADLPNPREVLENPASYNFTDPRLDRHFVVLTSVIALATSDSTKEAWDKAWAVLAAAADAERADVAVGAAIRLMKSAKPGAGWMPPASVKAFMPILKESGLIKDVTKKEPVAA